MARPVIIIHFQPLELYPPILNLVTYINTYHESERLIVLTTRSAKTNLTEFEIDNKNILIKRLGKSGSGLSAISRYLNYLYFYLVSFFLLVRKSPGIIMYFETISSYPAYLYKKYVKNNIPLFIHYHEYTSPEEYNTGMKLVRFFHTKEQSLYPKAVWISHTNQERIKRFRADEKLESEDNTFILPNYPPKLWNTYPKPIEGTVKIIYAGALSMDTMFTENFARWVQSKNGKLAWDIYSNNLTDDARAFLQKLDSGFVRLFKGVNYTELSHILPNYNVGVILYNGHIPNYIYNAPNKLFEYLAVGLDVWYPTQMTGCSPYSTTTEYPKVIPLDFMKLNELMINQLLSKNNLIFRNSEYFYENVLPNLVEKLFVEKQ